TARRRAAGHGRRCRRTLGYAVEPGADGNSDQGGLLLQQGVSNPADDSETGVPPSQLRRQRQAAVPVAPGRPRVISAYSGYACAGRAFRWTRPLGGQLTPATRARAGRAGGAACPTGTGGGR